MKKFILFVMCIFTFVVGNATVNASKVHHSTTGLAIRLHRNWNFDRMHKRCPAKPLCSAVLTDGLLSFSFFAPIENAKIEISKDGIIIFSENYSILESSLDVQLPELEEGDYVIEVTNNDSLDLIGDFSI